MLSLSLSLIYTRTYTCIDQDIIATYIFLRSATPYPMGYPANACSATLSCTPYWEACHIHFLYIIIYVIMSPSFLICINSTVLTPLFKIPYWVDTCIETYILFPYFSIFWLFISIVKFFCCLLLLGNIFTLILKFLRYVTNTIFMVSLSKYQVFHASSSATHSFTRDKENI